MTAETNDQTTLETPQEDDAAIDPFNCIAPTRGNFPNAAAALVYYEARLRKARKAEGLLEHCAKLARTIIEHAGIAAADLRRLTPTELRKLGVAPEAIAELDHAATAPEQLAAAMASSAAAFDFAAEQYGLRASLLETTVTALLAQAKREGAL